MKYEIIKVLNNNTVLLKDSNKQIIGMGNGIGFSKKAGDFIDSSGIEKIFESTDNVFINRLSESMSKISEQYYDVAGQIIKYADEVLDQKMPELMYITLADHLFFAKERFDKGIFVPCPMKTEIKILYQKEFDVAIKAVEIANRELGTKFDDNESGLLAMHFLNTTINSFNKDQTFSITVVSEIVDIIEKYFKVKLDETSLSYARLLTHLHFLSLRMINDDNSPLQTPLISLDNSLAKARCCAEKISQFLMEDYKYKLKNNELVYLAVHIQNCVADA